MLKKPTYNHYLSIALLASLLLYACTEPFEIEQNEFENAIVVEATITNEVKFQEVKISNSTLLSDDFITPETNAIVLIKDENQNTYEFSESSPGLYTSSLKFSAQFDMNYQLFITTSTGDEYESKLAKTTSQSTIDEVSVKLNTNSNGSDEFRLFVNSFDASGESRYYRYTYEETYKIVAPNWDSLQAVVLPTEPIKTIDIVLKTDFDTEVCYQTKKSNAIIQTSTKDLIKDRVQFAVRKILADDFIISERYSILVKQYVQSYEAYTYFSILNKFTNSSSLLSQSQPGFFNGNIYSTSNKNNTVIGFFEVASATSKRVFFNYRDFFATGRPRYIEKCGFFAPTNDINEQRTSTELVDAIESNGWLFFAYNDNPTDILPGPYILTQKECGDCTAFGTNIKPSFWLE